ncbi:hypothetical protein EH223_02025 [candidate division KSB1 bacterium]|nr:MAG: hypothetical protein EH223_02025 [candidate division KSB1 bacterium]
MASKKGIELQLFALFLIALGGWLMHLRIHSFVDNPPNLVPFVFGLVSVFFVPILLSFKGTFLIGYLMNGFSVIIGVVVMTTFSLSGLPDPITFSGLMLRTALSYNLILLSKLFIGQMVLYHYHPTGLGRMFTAWWWARHFVYVGSVFAAGHLLWR